MQPTNDTGAQAPQNEPAKETTVFSLHRPTPLWATWVFRSVFNLSTGIAIFVAATKLIPDDNKFEIMLGIKAMDYIAWGFAKMLGVKKEEG